MTLQYVAIRTAANKESGHIYGNQGCIQLMLLIQ